MKFKNLCLLSLVVGTIVSCKQAAEKQEVIRPVKVAKVAPYNLTTITFSGIVTPDEYSNLAFRTSGPIVALDVVEGQSVKRGDVIAKIDPLDYQLSYDAKRVSYLTAKSQLERAEKLLTKEAISKQEYESTVAAEQNAKATYENAREMLNETTLRAPFSGFIQKKYVENHMEVRAGEKIVCLINPNKLQMEATLPDYLLSYIESRPELYVEFEAYKGTKFKAAIKEYVQASPDGSGVPIYVEITDPKFNLKDYNVAIGFSCSIELVIKGNQNLNYTLIPLSAVVGNSNNSKGSVFVYDAQLKKVNKREIEYGEIINGKDIIVESGLNVGDMVVSAGANRVKEGEIVKLLNN